MQFSVMGTPLPREWLGLQQFPAATQTKLFELLGKLKQEVFINPLIPFIYFDLITYLPKIVFIVAKKLQNVNTLTILVMGKGGVGKSSTINSLIGEQVVRVNAFQVSIAFICSFAFLA